LKSVKGQIGADFIADHLVVDEVLSFVENKPWKRYLSHKNGAEIGTMIISPKNIPTKFKFRLNQFCYNNEAKYEALITGLKILLELGAKCDEIKGNSELVVKQLTKEYKCVKENLIMYFVAANALLKRFTHVEIQHIPWIENQEANDLAQIASGYRVSKEKLQELIEIKDKRGSRERPSKKLSMPKLEWAEASDEHAQGKNYVEIFAIDNLTNNDWRKSIVNYL